MHRGANPAVPVRQPRTEANSDGTAEYLRYKCRQPNGCRHFLICPSCCQPSSSSLRWRYCPTPKDHPLHHETGNAPRSRLRICAQIGSWSVRRQHPYHYPDKLLLPFWTKYAVLGESLRLKIIRRRDRFRMRGQALRAQRGHDHRRDHHLARGRGEVPRHL